MVYTAATRSLALLEMLTQDAPLRANFVFLQAEIRPEIRVEEIDPRIARQLANTGRMPHATGAGNRVLSRAPDLRAGRPERSGSG